MTRFQGLALILALTLPGLAQAGGLTVPIPDRAETRQISVVVTPGIRSMKQVRSARLRNVRAQMHAGKPVDDADLRALAELGDGLAAQRYARLLLTRTDANPSDIAYFAAIAVGTGRVWTLPDMIDAMRQLSANTEPKARVQRYISVLYPHAWAGNTLALAAVQEFNGPGRLFGPMSEATRKRIEAQSARNSDGLLELRAATDILSGTPDQAELDRARAWLAQAEQADSLAAKTTAQNVLRIIEARANQN